MRRQLARDYPESALQGAGLSVMTGMSPSAQAYAEGAVTRVLKSVENKKRPPLQAGLVLTDVHDGDVLAVVGSRNVSQPGFNRAVEAQRPVGSLLKPFVYLLALAQPDNYSLASYVGRCPGHRATGQGQALDARAIPTTAAMARCAWSMRWRIPTTRPPCASA